MGSEALLAQTSTGLAKICHQIKAEAVDHLFHCTQLYVRHQPTGFQPRSSDNLSSKLTSPISKSTNDEAELAFDKKLDKVWDRFWLNDNPPTPDEARKELEEVVQEEIRAGSSGLSEERLRGLAKMSQGHDIDRAAKRGVGKDEGEA